MADDEITVTDGPQTPEVRTALALERSAVALREMRAVIEAQAAVAAPAVAAQARWDDAKAQCLKALTDTWNYDYRPLVLAGPVLRLGPTLTTIAVIGVILMGLALVGVDVGPIIDAIAHRISGASVAPEGALEP